MEGMTTEDEQVEELRKWWRKNGKTIVLALIVGLGALGATRYWMSNQEGERVQASALYDTLLAALERNDAAVVTEQGGTLVSQFSDTPYATLAALALAKVKYEQGDPTSAESYLRWVLDNQDDEGMRHIARLRLARVMLEGGRGSAALELVSDVDPGEFGAAYEELRGDIYVALGKSDEARRAYMAARAAPGMVPDPQTLQMKLDDVGGDDMAANVAPADIESLINTEPAAATEPTAAAATDNVVAPESAAATAPTDNAANAGNAADPAKTTATGTPAKTETPATAGTPPAPGSVDAATPNPVEADNAAATGGAVANPATE